MDTVHDVVIVGAGPVGLAAARMLGLRRHAVLVHDEGFFYDWLIRAVLIRPDHYVFGAVADLADTQELVTRYRDLVGARATHSPGEPISCV